VIKKFNTASPLPGYIDGVTRQTCRVGVGQGGGRCTGGGRRGGGKREKKGKITQHCHYFAIEKIAKGREPKNTSREPGLKGTGSGRFKSPCPSPTVDGSSWLLCE